MTGVKKVLFGRSIIGLWGGAFLKGWSFPAKGGGFLKIRYLMDLVHWGYKVILNFYGFRPLRKILCFCEKNTALTDGCVLGKMGLCRCGFASKMTKVVFGAQIGQRSGLESKKDLKRSFFGGYPRPLVKKVIFWSFWPRSLARVSFFSSFLRKLEAGLGYFRGLYPRDACFL